MFGSKDRPSPPVQGETRRVTRSHVAEGMSIKGDIEGDIDLLLEGRLEGNLRCREVVIGKSGQLSGTIVAQEAVIDGNVIGDIDAKTVRLNTTASVVGDVRHEIIEVAAGARIEGRYSRMSGKAEVKPTVKTTPHKADMTAEPPKTPAAGPATAKAKPDTDDKDAAAKQGAEVVPMEAGSKVN